MLITPNSSPASGELLDDSVLGGEHSEMPSHLVPESSHTIEIQYITHAPELRIYDSDATIIEEGFSEESFRTGDFFQQCSNTKICFEYTEEIATSETVVPEYYETNFLPDTPSSSNECSTDSYNYDANNSTETDLTNLNWLQNITNIMEVPSLPVKAAVRKPPPKPLIQNVRLHKLKQTIMKCQEDFLENLEEYQSNGEKKPPYSYCTMICLAMRYNGNKMTLSAIYTWIRENFKYYRTADPSWQNSIRHNLSLNKVFVKVARAKQEPGKGGFWKLDLARLEDSRRYKRAQSSPKPSKKKNSSTKTEDIDKTNRDSDVSFCANDGNSFQSDIFDNVKAMDVSMECDLSNQLPDFSLDGLEPDLSSPLHDEIGANVIVEPVLEAELGALLMANPWEDIQPDLLDNFLDSYLK